MSSVASGCLGHFFLSVPDLPMTIALARRYRPRRFADLLVQDHVAAALRGAVARNRVGHGYLLTGPRGVGKTSAARILAMALNCENRPGDGEPCGECATCLRIWNGSATLDVVEIDAASNRGVDDARDLRERAMYAASQEGHHKVYIIDEAHMLTREAWNALLKILEEPPPGVVFVFATTEPQKIANTAAPVMSRLQRFDFRRIGPVAIESRLRAVLEAEGLDAKADALLLIARHADGGMRDALSILDQCLSFGEGSLDAERVREVLGLVGDDSYAALLTLVANRTPGEVFGVMDALVDAGADLTEFAAGLAEVLRALVMHHYGVEAEAIPESTHAVITAAARGIGPEDAVRMLKLLGEAEPAIRRSANPRVVLETLLLRWAMMDRAVDLRALLEGLPPASAPVARSSAAPGSAPIPETSAPTRAPRKAPEPAPAARPAAEAVPLSGGPIACTTAAITAAWSGILTAAARQSRLVSQALEHAKPTVPEPGVVELEFGPDSAVFREGVAKQLATVEAILGSSVGTTVVVRIVERAGTGGAPPQKPDRISPEGIRAQRLQQIRAGDPALNAAADALDLELVDEG
jgi:DNA polymerase-3 subunit gamma/tau